MYLLIAGGSMYLLQVAPLGALLGAPALRATPSRPHRRIVRGD